MKLEETIKTIVSHDGPLYFDWLAHQMGERVEDVGHSLVRAGQVLEDVNGKYQFTATFINDVKGVAVKKANPLDCVLTKKGAIAIVTAYFETL